jgi:hypothetical protein
MILKTFSLSIKCQSRGGLSKYNNDGVRKMQKWEYHTEYLHIGNLSDKHLNELGEQGWELAALKVLYQEAMYRAVYKRPKTE